MKLCVRLTVSQDILGMRPYGSSTDINVLCKNQSSPAQSAQHHRPLAPCMLAHADRYHMLTPVCMPLSSPLIFCMLQTRNANQARLRARLKQPGESKTRVYRGAQMSSFFLFLLSSLLCSVIFPFEQAHPSIYLFSLVGGFCFVCPLLVDIPSDLCRLHLVWPGQLYTTFRC